MTWLCWLIGHCFDEPVFPDGMSVFRCRRCSHMFVVRKGWKPVKIDV